MITLPRILLILGLAVSIGGTSNAWCDTPETLRVATFNVALYGKRTGEVAERLARGDDSQARRLATVIQSVQPDVLLLCEIDYDADGKTLDLFADRYLAKSEDGAKALDYPYRWSIPSNTGLLADKDLNRDGKQDLPADAWGYGRYPGQYAMAVLSRYPIEQDKVRTFQTLRWCDFPNPQRPQFPEPNQCFHPDPIWQSLRLSSKNHVDVPIRIGDDGEVTRFHLLASHPTPPVFDGPADENGCRNHDEIFFWHHYLSNKPASRLVDDRGVVGGLPEGEYFVLAGDLNSDPEAGDSRRDAIRQLLSHPRTQDPKPKNVDGSVATAQFGNGNRVRVDYVLPSSQWQCEHAGVVWPDADDPLASAVDASDHRLVWVDLRLEKDSTRQP